MATKKEKEAKAEKAKRLEAINVVCGQIEQAHGKGTIQRMGDSPSFRDQPIISTGSLGLDVALGIGGYPRGRMVEIFGPESCIDGGSFIQYNVRTKEGRRMNHKGGTIQRLWERFHGKPVSGNRQGKYLRPVSIGAKFTAPCMNEEGGIFHNEILDVMNTGIKQCFEIFTLGGYSIIATGDHKFFTGEKWVALRDLEAGETLTVHNNTPFQKDPQEEPVRRTKERSYWYVKNHPVAGVKKVTASLSRENRSLKKDYFYKRLSASRGIVEAAKNGITVEEYKERLNSEDLEGLVFLDREDHVHHIDEDHTNDSFANLMVIKASEHGRLHAMKRHNDLRFTVIEDVISSIVPVGEKQTFDLRMESPFNNFIADNFVVHNSGKSTLALHAVAEVQRSGGFAAFIDVEHALDPAYAEKIGVNPKDIYLSQPDNAEQALEVVESLICSKAFDLVVVDSVAALVPKAEVEGDMGQSHMGLQARLMSQACRKLAGLCSTTNTTLFWINQIRHKIGILFGNPEVTAGGNALKFYASVRLDIRKIGVEKEGDKVIANKTRVKVVKNKVSPPFKQAEFAIQFNVGIARHLEVLDLGVEHELLQKNGAFYSFEESTIGQGRMKAGKWLLDHPEILDDLCTKLKTILLPPLSVGKKRPAIPSQKTPVEAPKKEKKPTKGTSKKKAGLPSKSLPTP